MDIRNEKYGANRISANSPMIVIWVDTMHVEVGDVINVTVKNQNGTAFFTQNVVVDKANAKKFFYMGKKRPVNGFAKGTYYTQVSFKRPGTNVSDLQSFSFVVY